MTLKFAFILVLILSAFQVMKCESSVKSLLINEFETLEKLLEQEMNLYYSKDWSSTKEDLSKPENLDLEQFNRSIVELFSNPRNHEQPTQKLEFQIQLKDKLLTYGYDNVIDQVFRVRYSETKNDRDVQHYEIGKNIIATLNGRYSDESKQIQRVLLKKIINLRHNKIDKKIFNETITDYDLALIEENFISRQKDKLLVIGGHYDTFSKNITGIEDNASASFALLELARLLKDLKYKLNFSILFVWFDFEELNALGSMSFNDHFLPNYLKKENCTFQGAIIMDMLFKMKRDLKSKQIEKTSSNLTDAAYQDAALNDSISIWYRKTDAPLANHLINSFHSHNSQLALLPVELEFQMDRKQLNDTSLTLNSNDRFYLRGDHSSFWSKTSRVYNLPTVFLTNMAPWRNSTTDCYHKQCDDLSQLTKENLTFLNKIIYALRDAIINLD